MISSCLTESPGRSRPSRPTGCISTAPGPAPAVNLTIFADDAGSRSRRMRLPAADALGFRRHLHLHASHDLLPPARHVLDRRAGPHGLCRRRRMGLGDPHPFRAMGSPLWRMPGDGLGNGCTTFSPMQACITAAGGPDFLFSLSGQAVALRRWLSWSTRRARVIKRRARDGRDGHHRTDVEQRRRRHLRAAGSRQRFQRPGGGELRRGRRIGRLRRHRGKRKRQLSDGHRGLHRRPHRRNPPRSAFRRAADGAADPGLSCSARRSLPPKVWTLHVGGSFDDVASSDPFYRYIETIFHFGVTGGCGAPGYCPASSVTRAQMAVFLLKAKNGSAYVPPACTGTVFPDVPCTGGIFDPWIEDLADQGFTGGCGGGNYCPATR